MELAKVLKEIVTKVDEMENVAGKMLDYIVDNNLKKQEQFNQAIQTAYDRNGWNWKRGRAADKEKATPPEIVTVYVSTCRAAYKEKLIKQVMDRKITTMYALRTAINKIRRERHVEPVTGDTFPALAGLQVRAENKLTGALIHDLVVIYEHIPGSERELLEKSLERLKNKYLPVAVDLAA